MSEAAVAPAKRVTAGAYINPADRLCTDNIRCLAANLPQEANSGHPGAPMGCASMAHVLWNYAMNFSPTNPTWMNRDRFVLSNGHACALQYSMLHLLGYSGMSLDDLKNFRKLGSNTPGHPEAHTNGIEVTTGPLGQGLAQAVGLAVGAANLAATYNKPDCTLLDNYTYVVCGDGCLQEGVAAEACSLAGHWRLGNLIALYDQNGITIDGNAEISFTENVQKRFEAYGWDVSHVSDGDCDIVGIKEAIEKAKTVTGRPSLIIVSTTIGYGSSKEGSEKTHGAPLGRDDLVQCRTKFGLDNPNDLWAVNQEVRDVYSARAKAGDATYAAWHNTWETYKVKYPTDAVELERRFNGELPQDWEALLPSYTDSSPAAATRGLSHATLNAIAPSFPEFIGGSADLTESNKSNIRGIANFSSSDYSGRHMRYGVREHAMAAIANGLFAYGAYRPYCATFLNFVTYAWGAVRLAALSNFGVLHIATHDSIELGEDGPTHQPIEVLPLLRATPNLVAIRPADGNECSAAYAVWLQNKTRPTVMALCRSNVPNLSGTSQQGAMKGAYIVADYDSTRLNNTQNLTKIILAGSGSELQLCVAAKPLIESLNTNIVVRVVSMPSWELFAEQSEEYRNSVLPKYYVSNPQDGSKQCNVYVEAAAAFGWEKYFDVQIGMSSFGASAPKKDVMDHFGFTPEKITATVKKHIGQ